MRIVISLLSVVLILIVLLDAFEAIVLPRRVTRQWRLIRFFYRLTWIPWAAWARRRHTNKKREAFLSFFGPLSLLILLCVWAIGLIVGFALIQWSIASPLHVAGDQINIGTYLYLSGTTFFTLGLGDVIPLAPIGRALAVIESGVGFGFLALIIGYLPVIYQGFSRRETNITLLDARAGSPPSGTELLLRHGQNQEELDRLLGQWEQWSAELMETHLSYPVLCYYRSQHDNQSWLAALASILDASAMMIVGIDNIPVQQASLTFAIARHAVVDLSNIFNTPPRPPDPERLAPDEHVKLRAILAEAGVKLREGADADKKLTELRRLYEPYVNALADYLLMPVPVWIPTRKLSDSWKTSAWERKSTGTISTSRKLPEEKEHF